MNDPSFQVPGELMEQLHQATQRLHERRMELEKAMGGMEYRHGERVAAAEEEFLKAEREVEEVEGKISQALASPGERP